MKKMIWAAAAALLVGGAQAALDTSDWLTAAQGTTGNVTASDNGGAGYTLDGTTGIAYNFGTLDQQGVKVNGSTVEYIYNFNSGPSVALGSMQGYQTEALAHKLAQWQNTGKFGLTAPGGVVDFTFATNSVFSTSGNPSGFVHVVFVQTGDNAPGSGHMDMYINGGFAAREATKANWRQDGGEGYIGAKRDNTGDFATGTMFGVASYDVALNATQIGTLYAAIPEPATLGIVVAFGGGLLFIRRKLMM